MSMMARFVAITSDQLATIQDTPEMVGGFALDAVLPSESPSNLQERLRRQAPQLMGQARAGSRPSRTGCVRRQ